MSLSAAVIDALVAAGATVEQLAAAVKADLAEAEQRKVEKRAKDAARQRKSRASRAVTVTPRDRADAPPKDINQTPYPSEPNGSSGSKRARKKSVSVELPDWMPAEPWAAFEAMRQGMHPKIQWSEAAAKLVISKITDLRAQGHCPAKLLNKAVVSSWRTVFEADDTKASAPIGRASQRPMNASELRRAIAFAEDNDNHERAAELKSQLKALCQTGPPRPIGSVVKNIVQQVAAE